MKQKQLAKKKLDQFELLKIERQMTCQYMDFHLTLLHEALQKDDQKEIEFQKGQLVQIREKLYELRYFRDK